MEPTCIICLEPSEPHKLISLGCCTAGRFCVECFRCYTLPSCPGCRQPLEFRHITGLNEEFLKRARNGELEFAKFLFRIGADIHYNNDEPFTSAVLGQHYETVQWLLDNNVSANHPGLVDFLINQGDYELLHLLVQYGAHVDLTHLFKAIQRNSAPCVRVLVNHGLQPTSDHLLMAADADSTQIANYLVESGVDLNVTLISAVTHDVHTVRCLLNLHDSPDQSAKDRALLNACSAPVASLEVVKELLDQGADVHVGCSAIERDACICMATFHNNLPLTKLLIKHDADVNANQNAPVITALAHANIRMLSLLYSHGAIVPRRHAVMVATRTGCMNLIKFLLKNDIATIAQIIASAITEKQLWLVKHFFHQRSRYLLPAMSFVPQLLRTCILEHTTDDRFISFLAEKCTPTQLEGLLVYAVLVDNPIAVAFLVGKVSSDEKEEAFRSAIETGNHRVATLLLDNRVIGFGALDLAIQRNQLEIVNLLLDYGFREFNRELLLQCTPEIRQVLEATFRF